MSFMINEEERTPYGTEVLARVSPAGTAGELAAAVEELAADEVVDAANPNAVDEKRHRNHVGNCLAAAVDAARDEAISTAGRCPARGWLPIDFENVGGAGANELVRTISLVG